MTDRPTDRLQQPFAAHARARVNNGLMALAYLVPSLASHPYFSSCTCVGERGRVPFHSRPLSPRMRTTRKNTDGLRDYGLPRPGLACSAHRGRIKFLRGYVSKSSAAVYPLTIAQLACEK